MKTGAALLLLGCLGLPSWEALAQPDLTARAIAYAEAFHKAFGSVVAEERYEQRIRRVLGSITSTTSRGGGPVDAVLVSDFLLVQVPGEGWLPFRDVFEVNGTRVRDREDRLAALFLSGGTRSALEQAQRIMNEGARYNIGNVQRNINAPTLALQFLTGVHRGRFRFTTGRREDEGTVLEFTETGRPTFVSTTGGRDLPVDGRFWVDEATGVIRRTELDAVDTGVEAHITVTYRHDGELDLWVPARMDERYRRGRDSTEVVGTATYSRFRRFQVTTSEETAPGQ